MRSNKRIGMGFGVAMALVGFFAMADGCSNQGEGQRCDPAATDPNLNADCQDGLTCQARALFGSDKPTFVCCPLQNPTTAECTQAANTAFLDSGMVVETGSAVDASSVDASPDTSTPVDSSTIDSPTDATDDVVDSDGPG